MDEGSAFATFTFAPEEAGTRVTWAFEFEVGMNPLLRIIGKFMDGMVGKDFEKGLARLKSNLEKMPAGPALSVEVIDFPRNALPRLARYRLAGHHRAKARRRVRQDRSGHG